MEDSILFCSIASMLMLPAVTCLTGTLLCSGLRSAIDYRKLFGCGNVSSGRTEARRSESPVLMVGADDPRDPPVIQLATL